MLINGVQNPVSDPICGQQKCPFPLVRKKLYGLCNCIFLGAVHIRRHFCQDLVYPLKIKNIVRTRQDNPVSGFAPKSPKYNPLYHQGHCQPYRIEHIYAFCFPCVLSVRRLIAAFIISSTVLTLGLTPLS